MRNFAADNPSKYAKKSRLSKIIKLVSCTSSYGKQNLVASEKKVVSTLCTDVIPAASSTTEKTTSFASFDELSVHKEASHSHCIINDSVSCCSLDSLKAGTTINQMLTSLGTGEALNVNQYDAISSYDETVMQETARIRRTMLYALHNARIRSLSYMDRVDAVDVPEEEATLIPSHEVDRQKQPLATISHAMINDESSSEMVFDPQTIQFLPKRETVAVQDVVQVESNSVADYVTFSPSKQYETLGNHTSSSTVRSARNALLDAYLDEQTDESSSSVATGPMTTLFDFNNESKQSILSKEELPYATDAANERYVDDVSVTISGNTIGSTLNSNGSNISSEHSIKAVYVVKKQKKCKAASNRSISSFETINKNISCTPKWLNDNIDRVWKQFDQCKATDGRCGTSDDSNDKTCTYDSRQSELGVVLYNDDKCNKTEESTPDVALHVYHYQIKNGSMKELGAVDSNIGHDSEDDDSTEDDVNAILDASDSKDDGNSEKDDFLTNISIDEKNEILSFRSFSPFSELGWSLVVEHNGKVLTDLIEKEVIYPILKPICELVEATEIPETRYDENKYHLSRSTNSVQST